MKILETPGVGRLVVAVVLGGLSIGLAPLALILFVHAHTGSFALAGGVLAAFGVGRGIATPLHGRLLDRFAVATVILPAAVCYAIAMGGLLAMGRSGATAAPMLVSAGVAGAAFPPLPALMRAAWPRIVGDAEPDLRAAYAVDALIGEVQFFGGMAVGALLVAVASADDCVVAMLVTSLLGCVLFVTSPWTRGSRPPATSTGWIGPLGRPMVRLAVAVWVPVGFVLAAFEVVAPAFAIEEGRPWAGGVLLALTGVGNAATALWYGGRGVSLPAWRVSGAASVALAATLALTAVPSTLTAMALIAVLLGAPHGPFAIANNQLIADACGPGATTEAFTWATTAIMIGGSLGGAVAGALVEASGWRTAAGACAIAACLLSAAIWLGLERAASVPETATRGARRA